MRARVRHLYDSVLAALDGLTQPLRALSLQTLMKDLLKRVHGVVHLLLAKERRAGAHVIVTSPARKPVGMCAIRTFHIHFDPAYI